MFTELRAGLGQNVHRRQNFLHKLKTKPSLLTGPENIIRGKIRSEGVVALSQYNGFHESGVGGGGVSIVHNNVINMTIVKRTDRVC